MPRITEQPIEAARQAFESISEAELAALAEIISASVKDVRTHEEALRSSIDRQIAQLETLYSADLNPQSKDSWPIAAAIALPILLISGALAFALSPDRTSFVLALLTMGAAAGIMAAFASFFCKKR